ncbi:MAG TPA: hydroxymethylbilane synthase [Thermoanaerobaculia bacterium]|nr:hydroxymethylbilane synthase [Thermoanaerobaculia bacterium]
MKAEAIFRLRLGTRRSALAMAQSGMVARDLEAEHPGLDVELVPIVTTGDVVTGDLARFGGKGLFTRELESGLLDGSLDLAVHSLKDLPVTLPEGLAVAAHPRRNDCRDVLVSEDAEDLDGLPEGAIVLTGALRRRAQILMRRPDLRVEPIRGNVDTRLRKWRELGVPGGVILAGAGLNRLALEHLPIHPLDPEIVVPAPGQGTLALEVRAGGMAANLCSALNDPDTARAAEAERRVVAAFGGDCTLPLAAWARREGEDGQIRLTGLLTTPDGRQAARGEAVAATPQEAADACVAAMRANGADEVLERIRAA